MSQAATTSPFATAAQDSDWVIWRYKSSLFDLQTDRRSDVPSENPAAENCTPDDSTITSPVHLERRQYNAILSRMDQASRRAASFSAWSS